MAFTPASKPYQGVFGQQPGFDLPPVAAPIAAPAAPKQPGTLDKALNFLNTPGGAAAIAAGGAGIAAYGANKSAGADRDMRAQQFAAEMAQRQHEQDSNDSRLRTAGALDASPMGAEQAFAQRQALLGAIMGGTRNFSATPGDPRVAAAMGSTNQGGMRIPEGGFDPAMLERMFGDKTTMGSIASRQQAIGQLNPRSTPMDLGSMFGDAGTAATHDIMGANSMELERQHEEAARQRSIIQRAIDEDIRGSQQPQEKKGGGNIFGKILKGVGMGASFIPGIGQIVAPIASGLGGLVNGDGLKSSLLDAGLAALPAGLGKVAKGAGTAAKIAKTVQKIPSPIQDAILGKVVGR